MRTQQPDILTICDHCGDDCPAFPVRMGDRVFCCEGCKSVFQILNGHDLCTYYELNPHPGISQKAPIRADKFAFLDQAEIAQKIIQYADDSQIHATFYLPQIHCSSCLWLLENLRRVHAGIISSRVNFASKEVTVAFDPSSLSLRQVVELLTRIGYEPHLSLQDVTLRQATTPNRARWYKIGLAGFCFGNIMMLSFPEYFAGEGALEPQLKTLFSLLIILLSIPVITYAASEFFIAAWKGLRQKYLNIDAPIALALLITFGRSLYEIGTGTGAGYLDSMSGIVFFMLIGRWLQDKTYQTISFDRDYKSFFPIAVNVIKEGHIRTLPVEDLKVNDLIQIHHAELVPVDAILSKGQGEVDYSFVTGESLAVPVNKGEIVYAGGKQMGGILELLVVKEVSQSYLTHLWNRSNKHEDPATSHSFIDQLSRYFTYIVLFIGATAAVYWSSKGESQLMWNALTTILIVACPCALLLSANFTRGNMLRILSRKKLYLRNAQALETLSRIDTIVFDKTGTLTQKNRTNVRYEGMVLTPEVKSQLASLLVHSTHPLSKAVFHYLNTAAQMPVSSFRLIENQGIEGWIEEHHIKIGSPEFTGMNVSDKTGSIVTVTIDQKPVGQFHIGNVYRFGVFDLFHSLRKKYRLALVSGDNDAEATTLQQKMGGECDIFFDQRPDDKMAYIRYLQDQRHSKVLMVGDGLNDAAALQQSDAGIAICEDDNNFTPAADGILHASNVPILDRILLYIKAGRKIILFSFGISIIYNIIGLYFAVQGTLSPIIAAILMPASSITIILLTYGMSGWMARKFGLVEGGTLRLADGLSHHAAQGKESRRVGE